MLTVNQISKTYNLSTILDKVSFTLNQGERLGLVGSNGCGKTTLLKILIGEEKPDGGSVQYDPPSLHFGYLPQGFTPGPAETISSFLYRMEGDLDALSGQLELLADELVRAPENIELHQKYDEVLTQVAAIASGGGDNGPAVLSALGLGEYPSDTPVANLSGGQKTRLSLAGILLSNPRLILLDEPTNHLDLEMLEWLETWLISYPGAVLVVSHDRAFLDHTAIGILEIDGRTHRLHIYNGNYSDYMEQKNAELARHWQQYSDQQDEIVRLTNAARHMRGLAKFRKGGKADTGDKFAKGFFANRGLETVRRAKHIEQRIERLQTIDHIEKPKTPWEMKIEFSDIAETGRDVIALEHLSVGYGEKTLLGGINQVLRYGQRVALIGPNGSGKTTLLRTITGVVPLLAGRLRIGSNVKIGYMAQEQETLEPELNPLQSIQKSVNFTETEARSFLSKYLFKGDDVFIPARSLSYGERSRLMLACLVATGCNLLLLDEPINHLDIPARLHFEEALSTFEGTVLAIVHDRYFIEGFATHIWEVQAKSLIAYPKE
jgi:ATP-binding cassette, subfamily F, member 3